MAIFWTTMSYLAISITVGECLVNRTMKRIQYGLKCPNCSFGIFFPFVQSFLLSFDSYSLRGMCGAWCFWKPEWQFTSEFLRALWGFRMQIRLELYCVWAEPVLLLWSGQQLSGIAFLYWSMLINMFYQLWLFKDIYRFHHCVVFNLKQKRTQNLVYIQSSWVIVWVLVLLMTFQWHQLDN